MLRWATWGLALAAVALAGISALPLFIFLLVAGGLFTAQLTAARERPPALPAPDAGLLARRAAILRNRVAGRLLDADTTMADSKVAAVRDRFHEASHLYIRASARLDRSDAAATVAIADLTHADWHLTCAEAILRGEALPERPVLLIEEPAAPAPMDTACPDCLEPRCTRAAMSA